MHLFMTLNLGHNLNDFMVMLLACSGSCLFLGIREDTLGYDTIHPLNCDFMNLAKNIECTNIFSYIKIFLDMNF